MNALQVRDLMTDRVFAVTAEDSLETLHSLMAEHDVRHMPVVDSDGDLRGLVSHRDLLRGSLVESQDMTGYMQNAVLQRLKVEEIMTEIMMTTEAETDLREAASLMLDNKIGCLPVVEGSRLVGILTESDFVRFLARGH